MEELGRNEILENLRLLSEWLHVKYPGETFEITVVGGAAMVLSGFKEQTKDIDLIKPETLPVALKNGIVYFSKAKRLSPGWLNNYTANILRKAKLSRLPEYFNETSLAIDISDNLTVNVIGRQALLSLKLWAATPSFAKHTNDIKSLKPSKEEIKEAVRFVLSVDNTEPRRDALEIVLRKIGFHGHEFISGNNK
ncbi:MAG: hypothetical protein JRI71_00215 [Deltaproteobacteria bacterium]|nr:hypothetical protein [Deltaproteobacteria bacterium]